MADLSSKQILEYIDTISVIITDLGGVNTKIIDCNKGAEKIFAYSKDELIGQKVSILHLQEDVKNFGPSQKKLTKEKKGFNGETTLIRKGGIMFPALLTVHPFSNEKGEVIGTIGTAIDISKQKSAETRYSELFNNMANGVAIYKAIEDGEDFVFVNLNKAGQKLSKVDPDDFLGRRVTEVFPGVKDIGLFDVFKRVYKTGVPEMLPLSQYKDKRISEWVENYVYKLPSDEIVAIYDDLSEKQIALESLRISEAEKTAILNGISNNITLFNTEKEIIWANKNVTNVYGDIESLKKKKCHNIYHDSEKACKNCPVNQSLKIKGKAYAEIIDKYNKIWRKTAEPVYNERAEIVGILEISEDVTELRETDKELKEYREQLENLVEERTKELESKTSSIEESRRALTFLLEDVNEARMELNTLNNRLENVNKELEAFAYSVSHDLRAPLRHIDGFIQLLKNPENLSKPEKVEKYTDIISNSAQKMGRLIDDLLTFSRIGRNEVQKQLFDLNELIDEIWNEFKPNVVENKVNFTVEKLPKINGDRNLLRIVFYNLIDNAIKFSGNKEEIIIQIGSISKDKSHEIFVKDNGAGFNMKYVDKLFGVFQRLHLETEFEGTGIGLASVQRILHKHGGEIRGEGTVNKGATFFVRI